MVRSRKTVVATITAMPASGRGDLQRAQRVEIEVVGARRAPASSVARPASQQLQAARRHARVRWGRTGVTVEQNRSLERIGERRLAIVKDTTRARDDRDRGRAELVVVANRNVSSLDRSGSRCQRRRQVEPGRLAATLGKTMRCGPVRKHASRATAARRAVGPRIDVAQFDPSTRAAATPHRLRSTARAELGRPRPARAWRCAWAVAAPARPPQPGDRFLARLRRTVRRPRSALSFLRRRGTPRRPEPALMPDARAGTRTHGRIEHACGDRRRALAVGGQHHSPLDTRRAMLEEPDSVEIEVVGGLVEDERLVVAGAAGERDPFGLPPESRRRRVGHVAHAQASSIDSPARPVEGCCPPEPRALWLLVEHDEPHAKSPSHDTESGPGSTRGPACATASTCRTR